MNSTAEHIIRLVTMLLSVASAIVPASAWAQAEAGTIGVSALAPRGQSDTITAPLSAALAEPDSLSAVLSGALAKADSIATARNEALMRPDSLAAARSGALAKADSLAAALSSAAGDSLAAHPAPALADSLGLRPAGAAEGRRLRHDMERRSGSALGDDPIGAGLWPDLPDDELPPLPEVNRDSIDADFAARYGAQLYTYRDDYFERFDPIPAKAVWYAALIPGGGQIYNRKYWKLPIIYGGYFGLIYGYRFNQRYYRTYSNAYRDLVLGSPNASYRDFLPPNFDVSARYSYLEKTFKRKKNAYRNYRDYCVVGMLGIYLVAMVDAYVDAALYHFDVSPELDANNSPALMLGYRIDF